MLHTTSVPDAAKNPLAWGITFLLALLAWIPTLLQSLSMPPMSGTMGMRLVPFLLFWTIMMVAMMLPAFAPMVSLHFEAVQERTPGLFLVVRIGTFLLGYLSLWMGLGVLAYLLALLGDHLIRVAPQVAIGLGVGLCFLAGVYQLTPLMARCLAHCNLHLDQHDACANFGEQYGQRHLLQDLHVGIRHGIYCLGCCGLLTLLLVAVGLMNLFWMLIITLIIFLEKIWYRGKAVSVFVGVGLLLFGFLACLSPWLLPGLYSGL